MVLVKWAGGVCRCANGERVMHAGCARRGARHAMGQG